MGFQRASAVTTLAQSGAAVAHTGDTNEFTFASVTVPGGAMGANGRIEVWALWSYPNSANSKTLKVKLGATAFSNFAASATTATRGMVEIANRNSASSQVGINLTTLSTSTGAILTGSIDTTVDQTLAITGTLALGSETLTLESYSIRLFR